jgi:hypothetical protein
LIKASQERITKLREQYALQVKQYNERVSAIEARSKSQRSDIEASIKKLEKENEDTMASIDAYNKETDAKIASLNTRKGELAELGVKKVVEYQGNIQSLRNQNTELKEKIVHTDVGTFKFIANSFGIPLDKAVNYFIWSIMLVFDPLAIALILAYNSLVGKDKKKEVLPQITPSPTPSITPTPEATIEPTPSNTSEPTTTPTPSPTNTPEPLPIVEEVQVPKQEPPPANEPFLRDYERFSRPNP